MESFAPRRPNHEHPTPRACPLPSTSCPTTPAAATRAARHTRSSPAATHTHSAHPPPAPSASSPWTSRSPCSASPSPAAPTTHGAGISQPHPPGAISPGPRRPPHNTTASPAARAPARPPLLTEVAGFGMPARSLNVGVPILRGVQRLEVLALPVLHRKRPAVFEDDGLPPKRHPVPRPPPQEVVRTLDELPRHAPAPLPFAACWMAWARPPCPFLPFTISRSLSRAALYVASANPGGD